MPKQEFVKDFEKRPGEVIGDLYDVTLNGTELGSGSIRVTNPELQGRIMNFIGLSKDEAERKFGFLLHAYEYGAPVHGGMGLGVDRLVALMIGTKVWIPRIPKLVIVKVPPSQSAGERVFRNSFI